MGNKPRIRFKGFTEDWEQRKLSDVADVRDGTHDSPKFYNDGFPLVTSKNLKDGSIDFSDCSFISEQDFNEINKRSKVDLGDILFGMIGTIGKPAIVEHTGFAIKNVALIKEGDIINNRFIYHLLSSKVFDDYIARENAGGTQKFIALNQIRNFIFSAPTLAEQNKIIELLDYISQTITLHQCKLEKLKLTKKALLQKLFPKNGKHIPEIRFKGFTDAWEQRKLGEIADITKLAGFEFTKYIVYSDKGNIIALRGLNIKDGDLNLEDVKYIDSSDFTKLKRSKLFRNDILFTYVGTIGEVARIQEADKYYLAPNVSRIRIKNRLLSEFLMYYMDRDLFYQKIIFPLIATSSQPALSMANIREFNITYPSDTNEQQKIALVFNRISHLITLHQRKLERLQEVKKGLLQKMFV